MIKKLLLLTAGILFITSAHAQLLHTLWNVKAVKVNTNEYDIVFTVKIDPQFHIYSSIPVEGVGPRATEVRFNENGAFQLVGKLKESKAKSEMDDGFGLVVSYFEKTATFTQRIKVLKPGKVTIDGKYEYEICKEGACEFPPAKKFSVEI
ncbi:MAG: thiol:disulfide interchange protein [Bacteroidetes bacterium]|jgi:thiol:disulfide interchange protein DsbD|nr:thiol:disulfide interchange protein [Bacteroidota bacterium]